MRFLDEARFIVDQIRRRTPKRLVGSSVGFDRIVRAVLIAEDRRFRHHIGIDWFGILRAFWTYVAYRRVSGASTIEQQLVRTLRGRYEVTLTRKLSEMAISVIVARSISKDEIISVYLNVAYFGWRATGIVQAARRLDIIVEEATWREAATLAALLKLPMPRFSTPDYARRLGQRVSYILERGGFE